MEKEIQQELLKINPGFSNEEIALGMQYFVLKSFKSKEHILNNGEIGNYLFFAESSITRCYYFDNEGTEQTLWMKPERTFITEYKSFVHQKSSEFTLQFYEDTQAYCISRSDLLNLYKTNNNWALFGIFLTEYVHINLIDVFVNLLSNDATQNYKYIEYMFPRFLLIAPLKDIASMLQVSQVSLSRIRSGTQTKKAIF